MKRVTNATTAEITADMYYSNLPHGITDYKIMLLDIVIATGSSIAFAIEHLMGDYAMTAQPQTLARRNINGAAPSPDVARLQGSRFVSVPEPSKGMELDAALVKQLTGGDAITARFLGKNPIQFKPNFKIFVGANHMPKITDRTILTSGRMKIIPFNRHFRPEEQDNDLKRTLEKPDAMSGILNWMLAGYSMYRQDGKLQDPEAVKEEIENFKLDALGQLDEFLSEYLIKTKDARIKTHDIHKHHCEWARERGFRTLSPQAFVGELRVRKEVKRHPKDGNTIAGYTLKEEVAKTDAKEPVKKADKKPANVS